MPVFYFDTYDGKAWVSDAVGLECESVEAALDMAQSALPDIARDELPDGPALTMVVRVRDEAGQAVAEADLDLRAIRYGEGV